ncbi:hypothetical protein SBADM41S_05443 [Streptomyces badius]
MEMPRELEKDEDPAEAVRRILSKNKAGARVWPDDDAVREAIRTRPFYKAGRSNQRLQVLRRLEESYGESEPVDYAKARLTVEHVLPQNPAQQWFDLLAEEAEDGQGPDELHALLVHTLGNLTLSGDNAKLSNHPFRRKQEILDSSALRMNQEIAGRERWGRAEILDRAARLADRAVRLWPGPVSGTTGDDEWSGWKELRAALLAMPTGTWTTYGDVAALIGTHAVPVGQHLASKAGLHGAYRVLTADGRVSVGFRRPATAGENLYRIVIPAKVAAQVGQGMVRRMASKAVVGGVRGPLVDPMGRIVAHATYVPVKAAAAGAAGGAGATAGVTAVGGAGSPWPRRSYSWPWRWG